MISVFRKFTDRLKNYKKDSAKQMFNVEFTIESQGETIGRFTFKIRGHSKAHAQATADQVRFKVDTIKKLKK